MTFLVSCSGGNNNRAASPSGAPGASPAVTRSSTPRTPTPFAGALTSATPSVLAADPALQQALESAAVQPSDAPAMSGYTKQSEQRNPAVLPGQVAGYTVTYTQSGISSNGTPAVQALVVTLAGFRDANAAHAQLASLQTQVTTASAGTFKFSPIPNRPQLGDESQSFGVGSSGGNLPIAGYAVIWWRGRVAAVIVQIGAPAPASIDDTSAIAGVQDNKLRNAGQ